MFTRFCGTGFVAVFAIMIGTLGSPLCAGETTGSMDGTLVAMLEEVHVWGRSKISSDAGYVSPTSVLKPGDMQAINVATTEDLVKYEPSLVIRRRYIGDANGTLGIRGSNMFQTARSMVFADGVPLHYLLQSRWNGAPRWTLVSASEIAQIEVVYGPFSAEYSGNAMGGVVLIETAIPKQRQFHFDASYFNQEFDAYGFDDHVDGFRAFAAYGDKLGSSSVYFSYNHLENTSQPQTFRDTAFDTTLANNDNVQGAILNDDAQGRARYWYGDTGVVETITDNVKFKLGYEWVAWQGLLNIAYEDRYSHNTGQSYIEDFTGETLWASDNAVQNGQAFGFGSGNLNTREFDRHSLSVGLRLKGQLGTNSRVELNLNRFAILKDETKTSLLNPNDDNYSLRGEVQDYNDSGWQTAEIKFTQDDVLASGLELISGLRHEAYELNLNVFDSPNYLAGIQGDYSSRFGGKTAINAAFVQANWQFTPQWDAAFGLRYETFDSSDGYYDADDVSTPQFDLVSIPAASKNALSPKFSLGFRPKHDWLLRYSLAKAYRFPIVEELFSQYRAYNTVALANPNLQPESGIHHNLMIDRSFANSNVRLNIFQETVKDAIESQTDTSTNVRSFVPIDKVDVWGVEFVLNQKNFLVNNIDIRFNLTWLDAEVVDNSRAEGINPENSIEGNDYPRMPEWRSNLLATYHVNPDWDLSTNIQYASDSFGRLDNEDTVDNVYGAQDAYTRVGLKATYRVSSQWRVSLGVDNVTNEIDYVAHPWPGRTAYCNFALQL